MWPLEEVFSSIAAVHTTYYSIPYSQTRVSVKAQTATFNSRQYNTTKLQQQPQATTTTYTHTPPAYVAHTATRASLPVVGADGFKCQGLVAGQVLQRHDTPTLLQCCYYCLSHRPTVEA